MDAVAVEEAWAMEDVATPSAPEMGTATAAPPWLSVREVAALRAFAAGEKGPGIARALGVSYRTLKRITADLQERLEAPSMFVLGMRTVELGLLSPDEAGSPDGASASGAAAP